MGRHIFGDIKMKLGPTVQNSNAADRFGVEGKLPSTLYYVFDEDDLDKVNAELKVIEQTIGIETMKRLNEYRNTSLSTTSKELEQLWSKHSKDMYDYDLGIKIRDCIEEQGWCEFKAEL